MSEEDLDERNYDTDETAGSDQSSITATPHGYACIVNIYGGEIGKCYAIERPLSIGRDKENTIALDLPNISRRHARLYGEDDAYYIEDCESTNGIFVNSIRIAGLRHLANGDLIKVGGAFFKFLDGGNVESLYHEEIYHLAISDGLTGIPNKRYFLEHIGRETARCSRHGRPLSLALMDIDRFKLVNDTYGHLAGDSVLQQMATLVQRAVREDELFARCGGEEFAVILPETDLDGARGFGERIRQLIEAAVFTFEEKQIHITVSIGVATFGEYRNVTDLTAAADKNLYTAKKAGRNRVVADPNPNGAVSC